MYSTSYRTGRPQPSHQRDPHPTLSQRSTSPGGMRSIWALAALRHQGWNSHLLWKPLHQFIKNVFKVYNANYVSDSLCQTSPLTTVAQHSHHSLELHYILVTPVFMVQKNVFKMLIMYIYIYIYTCLHSCLATKGFDKPTKSMAVSGGGMWLDRQLLTSLLQCS